MGLGGYPSDNSQPPYGRLDRLDHLRAIAAFMVLAWHLTPAWPHDVSPMFRFLSIFKEGHTGVSLFCVISGFILTIIYAPREQRFFPFYRNRFLRIAPLFIFVVCLSYYASDWDAGNLLITSLTGLVRGGLPSYAGPAWTVLVECQFYLLFPLLLIFSKRYGTRYLVGLLLAFILTKAAVWSASGSVQQVAYYSIFGRIDQFLIGMIAALAISSSRAKNFSSKNAAYLLAAGVLLATAFFWWFHVQGGLLNFDGEKWPSRSALWIFVPSVEGVIYALVVIGYLHLRPLPYTAMPSHALAYIGRVSYSMYLIHLLLLPTIIKTIRWIGLAPSSWEQALLVTVFIALPILVAASSISYHLIELPFMQLRSSARDAVPLNVVIPDGAKVAAR
jgi:peptidoglycan/LPS O-acetylase OafA/YrhL